MIHHPLSVFISSIETSAISQPNSTTKKNRSGGVGNLTSLNPKGLDKVFLMGIPSPLPVEDEIVMWHFGKVCGKCSNLIMWVRNFVQKTKCLVGKNYPMSPAPVFSNLQTWNRTSSYELNIFLQQKYKLLANPRVSGKFQAWDVKYAWIYCLMWFRYFQPGNETSPSPGRNKFVIKKTEHMPR